MEVPPNIEAKPIGSPFPTLFANLYNTLLLQNNSKFIPFPILGRPLAVMIGMSLIISSGQ
jgi:hypothetical protein